MLLSDVLYECKKDRPGKKEKRKKKSWSSTSGSALTSRDTRHRSKVSDAIDALSPIFYNV